MSDGFVARSAAALGRPAALASLAAAILGATALVVALLGGLAAPALATLTSSWLFAAGCAAGGLAFAAAIRLAGGRWATAVLPVADASAGFFLPALAMLGLIVLAAHTFVPWVAEKEGRLAMGLVVRQLGVTAVLF